MTRKKATPSTLTLPRAAQGTVSERLLIPVSPELKERVRQAAEAEGVTISEWARRALEKAATRALGKPS